MAEQTTMVLAVGSSEDSPRVCSNWWGLTGRGWYAILSSIYCVCFLVCAVDMTCVCHCEGLYTNFFKNTGSRAKSSLWGNLGGINTTPRKQAFNTRASIDGGDGGKLWAPIDSKSWTELMEKWQTQKWKVRYSQLTARWNCQVPGMPDCAQTPWPSSIYRRISL